MKISGDGILISQKDAITISLADEEAKGPEVAGGAEQSQQSEGGQRRAQTHDDAHAAQYGLADRRVTQAFDVQRMVVSQGGGGGGGRGGGGATDVGTTRAASGMLNSLFDFSGYDGGGARGGGSAGSSGTTANPRAAVTAVTANQEKDRQEDLIVRRRWCYSSCNRYCTPRSLPGMMKILY